MKDKIEDKALKRLKHEGDDQDEKLKDEKSDYYQQEGKYAMAIYAYFECHDCHQPYFGGRRNCAEAMQAREGEKFDPKELICPSCCPVEGTNCKRHGSEFISFKCRYCCSMAVWFCWGNTHFCDPCHRRPIQVRDTPKNKLPKCKGSQK